MVSFFFPSQMQAAINLRTATIFTRINVIADPQTVEAAIAASSRMQNIFHIRHYSDVLIFDVVPGEHHAHVNALLDILLENQLYSDINRCAFDKPNWKQAGFCVACVNYERKQFAVALVEDIAESANQEVGNKWRGVNAERRLLMMTKDVVDSICEAKGE